MCKILRSTLSFKEHPWNELTQLAQNWHEGLKVHKQERRLILILRIKLPIRFLCGVDFLDMQPLPIQHNVTVTPRDFPDLPLNIMLSTTFIKDTKSYRSVTSPFSARTTIAVQSFASVTARSAACARARKTRIRSSLTRTARSSLWETSTWSFAGRNGRKYDRCITMQFDNLVIFLNVIVQCADYTARHKIVASPCTAKWSYLQSWNAFI